MKEKYLSSECVSLNISVQNVQVTFGATCSLELFFCPRKPTLSINFFDRIHYLSLHSTLSKLSLLLLLLLCASVWNHNACLKDFDPKGGKPQGSLQILVCFCMGGDFINSAVFLNFLFSCASRNGCSTCPQS